VTNTIPRLGTPVALSIRKAGPGGVCGTFMIGTPPATEPNADYDVATGFPYTVRLGATEEARIVFQFSANDYWWDQCPRYLPQYTFFGNPSCAPVNVQGPASWDAGDACTVDNGQPIDCQQATLCAGSSPACICNAQSCAANVNVELWGGTLDLSMGALTGTISARSPDMGNVELRKAGPAAAPDGGAD
jgi:hypothetical protein